MPDDVTGALEIAQRLSTVASHVAAGRTGSAAQADFTAELAGGRLGSEQWRRLYYSVLCLHPEPSTRCNLAATGPLGMLRMLVCDPEPEVRYAVLFNPLLADHHLQVALAGDPEELIVVGLLDRISPSAQVCQIIMDGPHTAARRHLARMRIRSGWLRELAADEDLVTRCIARARLDACGELLPASDAREVR